MAARARQGLRGLARSEHLWVPLGFLVLTWAVRFGSLEGWHDASYAGDMAEDAGQFIWHFLHLWRAITGHSDLFHSDQVFYPVGLQMVQQDWAPTAALMALPFQVVGPLFALNVQVLLAFTLCGYFTYLLARHLSGDRLLAIMAGVIFAFCEFRMDKSFGHINQANQQFIPLYLLFLVRYFEAGKGRHAVGAAVCFFLATFCTYYQLVFVLLMSLFYVAHRVGVAATSSERGPALRAVAMRTAGFGAICAGACMLIFGPLLLNHWQSFTDASRSLTPYMPEYSADLLSYVQSNLYVLPSERIFTGEGGTAFLGYSVLCMGLLSAALVFKLRGAGPWVLMALLFFVISLGSTVMVRGEPAGELFVFKILQSLPVIQGAKVAARFSSLVVLCVAVAAAITLAAAERRWMTGFSRDSRTALKGLVVVITCAELLFPAARFVHGAMPTPFPVPTAYRQVQLTPGNSALMQFPLTWDAFTGNIGPHRFPRQFFAYQSLHGKPIFSGIGNMVPATTLRYLLRLPLVGELIQIGNGEQVKKSPAPPARLAADAMRVADTLDLRHIMVHKSLRVPGGRRVTERYQGAMEYLKQTLQVRPALEDSNMILLSVALPAGRELQGAQRIRFDTRGSLVHLGGGFNRARVAGGWQAEAVLDKNEELELYLRLPRGAADTLVLNQRCSLGPCDLRLSVNGRPAGELTVAARWGEQRVRLPADLVRPGLNRLRLEPSRHLQRAAGIPIGRTGVVSPVGLLVRSAGLDAGDRAEVVVGRAGVVPGQRGYNVAVLHPDDGDLLAGETFDLVVDPEGKNAARLAAFIGAVPRGMIVAVAVRDDGSIGVTERVVSALRSVGAAVDMRGRLRWSYALVGVKGAAPGTALEQTSEGPLELGLARRLEIRELRLLGR